MKLKDFNVKIENLFQKSKILSDQDFEKFLLNLELAKKNIMEIKKRKRSKLTESFRDFVSK